MVTVTVSFAVLPKSADTPRQYGDLMAWDNARVPFEWSDRTTPKAANKPPRFLAASGYALYVRPEYRLKSYVVFPKR